MAQVYYIPGCVFQNCDMSCQPWHSEEQSTALLLGSLFLDHNSNRAFGSIYCNTQSIQILSSTSYSIVCMICILILVAHTSKILCITHTQPPLACCFH